MPEKDQNQRDYSVQLIECASNFLVRILHRNAVCLRSLPDVGQQIRHLSFIFLTALDIDAGKLKALLSNHHTLLVREKKGFQYKLFWQFYHLRMKLTPET